MTETRMHDSPFGVRELSRLVRSAVALVVMMTLLLGVAYPLLVTALAQLAFHHKAGGSLIESDGKTGGSELLGQEFTQAKYFWGRLSATTPPYNAAASGGSNLSPANPELLEAVYARVAALRKADPKNKQPIPVDLATASGSGLDPHISPAAAQYQLSRVARARKLKGDDVRALIAEHTEGPLFGFIGNSRVNVLTLNRALDKKSDDR